MEGKVRCRRVWQMIALLPVTAVLIVVSSELLDLLIDRIVLSSVICTAVFLCLAVVAFRKLHKYTLVYTVEEDRIRFGKKKSVAFDAVDELRFTRGTFFDPESNELTVRQGENVLLHLYSTRNEIDRVNKDFLDLAAVFTEHCGLRKTLPDVGKENTDIWIKDLNAPKEADPSSGEADQEEGEAEEAAKDDQSGRQEPGQEPGTEPKKES